MATERPLYRSKRSGRPVHPHCPKHDRFRLGLDLAINKLDILTGFAEIPVCTAYRIDGKKVVDFPMTLEEVTRAEPIYETYPGWTEDLTGVREWDDLPANALRYVEAVAAQIEVPIAFISVGPGRDQTISLRDPFAQLSV